MQADIRTLESIGVRGVYAVTAVTAQNSTSVAGVMPVSKDLLGLQIDLAAADQSVAAAKLGMLATAENAAVVADRMRAGDIPDAIVDPVLSSSSGDSLISEKGVEAYRELLIPNTYILTPNIPEAELLTGTIISNVDGMIDAAMKLRAMGAEIVIVKGGHAGWETWEADVSPDAPVVVDIVVGLNGVSGSSLQPLSTGVTRLVSPRLQAAAVRGTGCTFSSAIAGYIARGHPVNEAIIAAKKYVTQYIARHGYLPDGAT
jgi:hydroxymethylpyrimidine/phosphomethylpyrimidine kinase